jgi:uncharacterized protein YecE (DUF72 family)
LKYYVGCKGWRNQKWSGEFYPPTLDPENYLTFYSKVFDFVEVDLSNRGGTSSFSNKLYDILLFKKWATNTPQNFRFTIKLPRLHTKLVTSSRNLHHYKRRFLL